MSLLAGRRWPAIDVIKLYEKGDTAAWNRMLQTMQDRHDVEGVKKVLYGVQAGMADAARLKLTTLEIDLWFIRIQRSLEMTAKKIFRAKYPHPLDNPLNKDPDAIAIKAAKHQRDQEFERFLQDARF